MPVAAARYADAAGSRQGACSGARDLNDGLTEGLGRSGSRYRLSFARPLQGGGRGQWRIDVDDAELCAVDTAEDAVRRAEGLEAIRCIIRGSSAELNDDQLQYAEIIAREMMEAADQALATAPSGDRLTCAGSRRCDQYRKRYGGITRREREDGAPVLPLPN
jgi:hypothetical protein